MRGTVKDLYILRKWTDRVLGFMNYSDWVSVVLKCDYSENIQTLRTNV